MAFVSAISDPHFFHTCNKARILHQNPRFPLSSLKSQLFQNPRSPSLVFSASGGGAKGNGEVKQEAEAGGGGRGELRRDRRPSFNIRWRDLLDPDSENILAVGLTGLLTWASVQYMTDGVLLRETLKDSDLDKYCLRQFLPPEPIYGTQFLPCLENSR